MEAGSLDSTPSASDAGWIMTSTSGARTLKILLGAALIVMGAIAAGVLWRSYQRAEETRHWTPTPAIVTTSLLLTERPTPHSPLAYRGEVHYHYTVAGTPYTGDHVRRVEGRSSDRGKAVAIVEKYPVGSEVTCYVNPADPKLAILEHSTRAALYSLWFPGLFMIGGAGMILSALRAKQG